MKNPYKTSTILLLIALIGVVIYYQNLLERKTNLYANLMDDIPEEELIEFFDFLDVGNDFDGEWLLSDLDSMTGKPLPYVRAKDKRDSFDTWNNWPLRVRRKIRPYGFYFGKYRIRELLNDIDSVNANGNGDEIIGVRAYLSRRKSRDFNDQLTHHLDLQFIPVKNGGKDYFDETFYNRTMDTDSIDMLLNTSAPCPNNCQN
ncbi:hypothetical protein EV198_1895 [Roseivirga ehrenbergii]|nr:hypothetical protein [Roseivirga ehrenbergii]TCL10863.1 hypothetical protein EV198_1895 [Roseivirga ehrenbergii]